jgi:fumarate reductase flavoprotein subunit
LCHNDPQQLSGTKINHRTEVVDREENPILSLYAAGNDASGMYGDGYNLAASGIGSSFALNSGRIAGESILSYLKGEY